MPIYEYRCRNGHQFEVIQRMSDDPLDRCQECQAPVERVFHPVAIHFKGKGFYNTDYGKKGKAVATAEAKESKDSSAADSKTESAGTGAGKDKTSGDT